jgi:ankyrin repeat protein
LGAIQHLFSSNSKNKLAQAITDRNWREVAILVQKSPRMARVLYRIEAVDDNKNDGPTVALPLHHCLMMNPPHQIVAIIIAAHPVALFFCDSLYKRYPMHIACRYGPRNFSVMETLLSALPDTAMVRDKHGRLPLHYAIENDASTDVIELLLGYYPWSAAQPDDSGWYPLHLACLRSSTSRHVLHKLVESWPPAASKHVQGQRPYDIVLAMTTTTTTTTTTSGSTSSADSDETTMILELLAEDDGYRVEHDLYSCTSSSSPNTMLIDTAMSAGRIQI